eukprot:SAG31_NODE_947_length_10828_cov_3.713953_7_plen_60_part_00
MCHTGTAVAKLGTQVPVPVPPVQATKFKFSTQVQCTYRYCVGKGPEFSFFVTEKVVSLY